MKKSFAIRGSNKGPDGEPCKDPNKGPDGEPRKDPNKGPDGDRVRTQIKTKMLIEIYNLKYRNEICPLIKAFFQDAELDVYEDASSKNICYIDICLNEEERSLYLRKDPADFSLGSGYFVVSLPDFYKLTDELEKKNYVKRRLYITLSMATGKRLPWGTLTGVRPVKLVSSMLYSGNSAPAVKRELKRIYKVSDEKSELAIKVAENEHRLLENIDHQNGYSLYVNIPFCPSRCAYCSFTSYPIASYHDRIDAYLEALSKEIEAVRNATGPLKLQTVYVGGGTPTTLSASELDRLLSIIEDRLCLNDLIEMTVEAGRPDSISYDKLSTLKAHNVSRISINPQTMNQKTLDIIGRRHTVEDIYTALETADKAGIDNINMDIILGLPQENAEDVSHTIDKIKEIAPKSLTIHSLAVKRAARLNIMKEDYLEYTFVNGSDIMDIAVNGAYEMGMEPYYLYRQKNMKGNLENIGFAQKDSECLYNILIMEELQTIMGVGAGATTKIVGNSGDKMKRLHNPKDVGQYLERIDEISATKRECIS